MFWGEFLQKVHDDNQSERFGGGEGARWGGDDGKLEWLGDIEFFCRVYRRDRDRAWCLLRANTWFESH